jgi:serine/threonine protein kinase/tetratricopeptide (TPR) repeat protein
MTGRIVCQYAIVEELGSGGMGRVYLAHDTVLDRKVALKFLPDDMQKDRKARRRFLNEAKCAAAVSHPYICKIYEITEFEGRDFIAMEYVAGKTLAETLLEETVSLTRVLQMAVEIAEALESAHAAGIGHYDLKPSNIMVTGEHIKVMDFGLARRLPAAPTYDQTVPLLSTDGRSLAGTPRYMSPEQWSGVSIDARSDIFSFGIMLYEMIAGVHPFRDILAGDLRSAILNHTPPPLSQYRQQIPARLPDVVKRMMARNLEDRYASISKVRAELSRISEELRAPRDRPASGQPPRIAVLPFKNLGRSGKDEAFSDGLTDSLITRLSNVHAVSVISAPSTMYFKGKALSIREIADRLNASHVVHGTFLKEGANCRITVQLIRAADDSNLWAEDYRIPWTDIFSIQDLVSDNVVRRVDIALSPGEEEALRETPTDSIGAYEAYMKGLFYSNKKTRPDLERAIEFFNSAISKDPDAAVAQASLANTYAAMAATGYGGMSPNEVMPKAREAALKALSVDDTLAEGCLALANILMAYDWDWEGAKKYFHRAIELNPGLSRAHQGYGLYLAATGDLDGALLEMQAAHRLDPMSPSTNADLGRCHRYRREHDDAIECYERAIRLQPDFSPAHLGLALTYVKKHEHAEGQMEQMTLFFKSIAEFQKGLAVKIDMLPFIGSLVAPQETADESHRQVAPFVFAFAHAILGNTGQAVKWLKRALEERSEYMIYLKVDPVFDRIRADPGFQELLGRVGLQ